MNMKKILEDFQNAMSAAAFAEEGEFESAREFLKPAKNANKKVLLVTDGTKGVRQSIKHAMTLCRRLEAQLEILLVRRNDASAIDNNEPMQVKVKAKDNPAGVVVTYKEAVNQGRVEDTVAEYGRGRRDILCVVLGLSVSKESVGKDKRSPRRSLSWLMAQLHCPVVVYSGSS